MPEQNPLYFYDWGYKLVQVKDCLEKKPGDVVVYAENPNLIRNQRNAAKMGDCVVLTLDEYASEHQHDWEPWDFGRLLHCKDSSCGLVVHAPRQDQLVENRPVNEYPDHHRSCLIRYGGGCSCG